MFIGDQHLTVLQKNSKNIFADIKLDSFCVESKTMNKCWQLKRRNICNDKK